jgi:hypothetical protein
VVLWETHSQGYDCTYSCHVCFGFGVTDTAFTFEVLFWSFFCNLIDKCPCTESGLLGCEVHLNGAIVVFIPYEHTWAHRYNKLCGMVTKLVSIIKKLDPKDPFRIEMTETLLEKL